MEWAASTSTDSTNQYRQHRAVASRYDKLRYDKLAVRYEATVHVATIDTWLRHLSHGL